VYVLEGDLNEHPQLTEEQLKVFPMKKLITYIGKEDFITRRSELLNDAGKVLMETTITNVKIGSNFPDGTFKYTPPEGAVVQDMDKQMGSASITQHPPTDIKPVGPQDEKK